MTGTAIPAYCPTCQEFVPSNAVFMGTGAKITVGKNSTTTCPKGHKARFLEGTYSFRDNILSIANTSPDTFKLVKEIAQRAIKGEIENEDAVREISAAAPSIGQFFKDNEYVASWFMLVITLYTLWMNAGDKTPEAKQIIINQYLSGEIHQPEPGLSSLGVRVPEKHLSKRKKQRLRGAAKASHRHNTHPSR